MGTEKKTLYSKIIEYIEEKIHSGEWLPGKLLPSELELADMFGVSRITAKKAMEELARKDLIYRKKGQGSFVSAIEKVNKTTGGNRIISMLIPYEQSRRELLDYVMGATDYLNPKRYYLSIHCTEEADTRKQRDLLINLPREGVEGIIYYPLNENCYYDILKLMTINGYPIIAIDKYFESLNISSVVSDNYKGTYDVISEVIKNGHNRIAFMTRIPVEQASSLRERFSAYCQAHKDCGLAVDLNIVLTGYGLQMSSKKVDEARTEYMYSKLKKLIESGVTCIMAENDMAIIHAFKKLVQEGLKIPDNFTMAGFDHFNVPNCHNISIEQDYYQIGMKAAELMCDIIERKEYRFKKIVLPTEIAREGSR